LEDDEGHVWVGGVGHEEEQKDGNRKKKNKGATSGLCPGDPGVIVQPYLLLKK